MTQYDGRLRIGPSANDTSVPGGGVTFRRAKYAAKMTYTMVARNSVMRPTNVLLK